MWVCVQNLSQRKETETLEQKGGDAQSGPGPWPSHIPPALKQRC